MMSAVTLTVGISLAYYNTCSLAFDTEPVIVSVDDDNRDNSPDVIISGPFPAISSVVS